MYLHQILFIIVLYRKIRKAQYRGVLLPCVHLLFDVYHNESTYSDIDPVCEDITEEKGTERIKQKPATSECKQAFVLLIIL